MAVQRAKIGDIPEGAIVLKESEVEEYHLKLIKDWKPMKEV